MFVTALFAVFIAMLIVAEHALELAMYLDLFKSGCFPSWSQVSAIADTVMCRLKADDPELCSHLRHIAVVNVQDSSEVRECLSTFLKCLTR